MHFVVILRRDSGISAKNELVSQISQVKIDCQKRKKDWYWATVSKNKENKSKNRCVFLLKVEFLSFEIVNKVNL